MGLALSWWHLHSRGYDPKAFLAKDALKIVLTMIVSLALFASWFLLDPDPHAIWRDFVLRENLGKFEAGGSYLSGLLWGSSSVWSLALAYPLNAGFLAFPIATLLVVACRRRRELSDVEPLLWIWVIALFLVYSVPSQRSGRYLLPAMPALAVLLALNCHRISRKAFVGSLLAVAGVLGAIAFLSVGFQGAVPGAHLPSAHWLLLMSAGLVVLIGLVVPNLTPLSVPAASLLAFLSLAVLLRPLDGPLGRYSANVMRYVDRKDVWVPYDFVAKYEGHRFLLPGARIHGYPDDQELTPLELIARYPLIVVRLPLGEVPCQACAILGRRLDLQGRQSLEELQRILLGGGFQRLFVNEVLVEAQGSRH